MRIVALALTLVLLAACGGEDEVVTSDGPHPSQTPVSPAAGGQRYTATATVLESPGHGPQLCLGGVAESLTLTQPPSEPKPPEDVDDDGDRFATPCPEPEGGWQVVDPAKATDEAMQQAIAYAEAQPSVGGVWIDQSINPAAQVAELDEIRDQVQAELGDRITYSSIDVVDGQVELGVTVDDGLQQRLDERYGEGVVTVDAALRPVEG